MASQFGGIPLNTQASGSRFGGVPLAAPAQQPASQPPSMLDAFTTDAYAPFKPIVDNTLEVLKNTAMQTGEAVSEPLNNPAANGAMAVPDAIIRTIGKAGNALGGVYGAITAPVTGAMSASVEPALPTIAKGISAVAGGDASQITPEQLHGIAMQTGGDLANAVMLGKAGQQGEAAQRQQQGLPPIQPPSDPLQPVYDKLKAMTADNSPRAGFVASNSSDPMQAPAAKVAPTNIDNIFDKADQYYSQADAGKPVLGAQPIQKGVVDIKNTLAQSNYDPDFHPQTAKWVSKLEKATTDDNGNPVDITWTKLNGMRKLLNGVINDSRKPIMDGGGYTEDGYQAIQARNALNNTIDSLKPTDIVSGDPNAIALTKQGNALYKAGMDAETLQRAVDKNLNKAVPATAIKGALDRIANNKEIMGRFTPEEQAAIQNGAATGKMDGALKAMSSRLMAGLVGMTTGAAGAGPIGAIPGYIAGEVARMPLAAMSTNRAVGNVQDVINMIGQRPAVQAAMNPVPPANSAPPAAPVAAAPSPLQNPLIGGATLAQIMQMSPAEAKKYMNKTKQ